MAKAYMKERHFLLWFSVLFLLFPLSSCIAQTDKPTNVPGGKVAELLGDWTGESTCVNKEKFPSCHDETVVYHIKEVAGKTNTVNLSADKIVNGKPEFMGAFDFVYDAEKHTLTSQIKEERFHFVIELVLKENVLEGGLISTPDRTQERYIKVKKK